MVEYDVSRSTTTGLSNSFKDASVDLHATDYSENDEFTYHFDKATKYLGYYKSIPELKKAIDALGVWVTSMGFETDSYTKVTLEHVSGWGQDSIQAILWNMLVIKKIVGDSFAEIIRNEKGDLLNIKPISPERMSIVLGKNGKIKRYEYHNKSGVKKFQPKDILHFCNDRIADEIHGTSVIEACQWVIDARKEALEDYRVVLHRNRIPVRIIEIDTDNEAKRNALIAQYEDAIKKGEVLVIPKGTVEMKDNSISIQDPTTWITYLENYFYQAVGVPRIIATSEGFTEAGGKVGFLTFEPVYTREQTEIEMDLWNQLGLKIKFNRPPSLSGVESQNEQKNSGQLGFQPKDTTATMTRE